MSDDRMSCPFCGCSSYIQSDDRIAFGFHVGCASCGARSRDEWSAPNAIAAWNRRAQPEGAATTGADVTDAMAEAFLDTWCQREKPTGEEWSISVIYGVKEALAAALKARTG